MIQTVMLQSAVYTDRLEVLVENIGTSTGIIKICLFDNEGDYMHKPMICETTGDFSRPQHRHVFRVPLDRFYAVIVYHDLNANGRLDRNFLGVPVEPYGFSNNPSTRFGPPGFEKARFHAASKPSISIRL